MSESQHVVAPTPDEILSAALSYARAGLKVYPVRIAGLKPDGKKDVRVPVEWKTASTDDPDQVARWWGERGEYPHHGIGVDMGKSGLAVADADVKSGVDGIARLEAELSAFVHDHNRSVYSEAPFSRTPSMGVHLWFADPDGLMGSGANIFGTKEEPSGVDGRGVGGTIFMPPTYVPGYGRYAWPDGEPDWAALPQVPARLTAACPPGGRKKSAQSTDQPLRTTAPHSAAYSAAYSAAAYSAGGAQGESQLFGGGQQYVPGDQRLTEEQAKARLMPLWEEVRDTHSPNGLWQAVASFARAAAHFECYWNAEQVGAMVLAAYAAGGHGYAELDDNDRRAIASAYAMQAEARRAGDLDDGWQCLPAGEAVLAQAAASVTGDAVDALLAEMRKPSELVDQPPQPYLIKGLLNLNSESWLIGAPGSRKSFVALDMAGHVARGMPWQGCRVRQGGVVLIVAEGGGGIGGRIKAWEMEHGPMGAEVDILLRPVQASNAQAWATLVAACERLAPSLIVLDTQARITVGLEENSATDMGIFINAVSALRTATGACVLAIHHTGRNGADARGSSALDGAQDTELKVVAASEPLRGELRSEKQKDLAEREPIKLAFHVHVVGVDEDGEKVTSLAVAGEDAWASAETEAEVVEPGQEVQVQEPVRDDWTWRLVPHNSSHVKRRVLAVIGQLAGEVAGMTKAEVCRVIRARWYEGRPLKNSKRGGYLSPDTWEDAWGGVHELRTASGEPVIVQGSSADRWILHPEAMSGLG